MRRLHSQLLLAQALWALGCAYPKFKKVDAEAQGGSSGSTQAGGGDAGAGSLEPGGRDSGGTSQGGDGNGGSLTTTGSSAGGSTQATAGASTRGGTSSTTVSAGGASGSTSTSKNHCAGVTATCQGESCCTAIAMAAGSFPMGRGVTSGGSDYYAVGSTPELPEHTATLSAYSLDKYEVTVARFRAFVEDYDNWHATLTNPTLGAGAIDGIAATGWGKSWTVSASDLPASSTLLKTALQCNATYATWSATEGSNDSFPINCVNWYVAFAFCIWDGGRLPTEAEWEYAAAGGSENRRYPWGPDAPDATRANFASSGKTPKISVGSTGATGATAQGHLDMAGSVSEWVFDWYFAGYYGTAASPVPCDDCVNTTASTARSLRGGDALTNNHNIRAAFRASLAPATADLGSGIRCAHPR